MLSHIINKTCILSDKIIMGDTGQGGASRGEVGGGGIRERSNSINANTQVVKIVKNRAGTHLKLLFKVEPHSHTYPVTFINDYHYLTSLS